MLILTLLCSTYPLSKILDWKSQSDFAGFIKTIVMLLLLTDIGAILVLAVPILFHNVLTMELAIPVQIVK